MYRLTLAAVILAAVPAAVAAQNTTVTQSSPVEAKLAVIDRNSPVVPTAEIAVYARLLNRLDRKCPEERDFIGDMAVKSVQLLESEKGVDMSIKRFLQAMDTSIPEGSQGLGIKCTEIAATLVAMIDRP